jgi:thiamine-phosphate pyrophosphorylase
MRHFRRHAEQRQSQRQGAFDATLWPCNPQDFGVQARAERAGFPACPQRLGLYAVLPDAAWVGRLARAGVPTEQLRFKHEDPAAIAREVRAAVAAVQGTQALLFINDHWRDAMAAGAYGVHLGQEDLDALAPEELAQLRASGLRLGVSTHGYAEMLRADAVAPSYIALGAVFPTTLKKMATVPQGVARLGGYVQLMQGYPLVAIGGIGAAQFPEILATGVGSIAVVRALVQAPHPEQAAAALLQHMQG